MKCLPHQGQFISTDTHNTCEQQTDLDSSAGKGAGNRLNETQRQGNGKQPNLQKNKSGSNPGDYLIPKTNTENWRPLQHLLESRYPRVRHKYGATIQRVPFYIRPVWTDNPNAPNVHLRVSLKCKSACTK